MNLCKPQKLRKGDKVGVVSPSWGGAGEFPARYQAGKKYLEEVFGVEVVELPNTLKPAHWLDENPEARADDLMAAFADTSIKGIITAIGGDDCIRLIPYLDLGIIRENPKIFMGYSDTTILHFACLKAGLSSFYGPSIMAGFAENGGMFEYTKDHLLRTIFSSDTAGEILQAPEWTVEHLNWGNPDNQSKIRKRQKSLGRKCLQGRGIAHGPLIGGCLDVFPMALGTSIWPDYNSFEGAILFVETSEEAPKVDDVKRIMRNLGVQGVLGVLNGLLIGRPGGGVGEITQYDGAIQDVVRGEFGLAELPILSQLDFGNTDPMCVLPFGAMCEINCGSQKVDLIENACVSGE